MTRRGSGSAIVARQRVKQWEIIADNLSKAGWSLGWVSAFDLEGRTIWIVDAHGYGNRFSLFDLQWIRARAREITWRAWRVIFSFDLE